MFLRGMKLITPPTASVPYRLDVPPRTTSIADTASRGMRSQYTHPPKGSLSGMPSSSTRARLAPLAPTPRKDTPWDVGLATRLPDRRKSWKPGTWRSLSSKVKAAVE